MWFRRNQPEAEPEDFTVSPDPYAAQLDRIELAVALLGQRLDYLISALGDDDEPEPRTLDGEPAGRERDESQPL